MTAPPGIATVTAPLPGSACGIDPALHGLTSRLRAALRDGKTAAARLLLAAVSRLSNPSAELAELAARVLLLENRLDAAVAALDASIAAGHDTPQLRLCRAELRLRRQDFQGAAADASEAVCADARLTAAKAVLGMALTALGQMTDAVACLRDAAGCEPGNAVFCEALAQALEQSGDVAGASAILAGGVARCPGNISLRVAAILLHMKHKDYAAAEALAEMAVRAGVADACVFGLLGHARSSLGQHEAAAAAYADARKLAPEDPYVRHLAAAAGLSADAGRAAPEYVEVVFDGYAARFDAHLISLGYRIPGLIRAALDDTPLGAVLDLGCGTGLAGVALSDLRPSPLVGVDLSSAMLGQARRRGLYSELHHAEIGSFLAAEPRKFPLILAADVLPYFGELDALCRLTAARLTPGGRFLFSVEELPRASGTLAPWRLGRLGRYQHAAGYVRAAAVEAGLAVQFLRRETLRLEGRAPVPGLFIELRRSAA